MNNQVALLEEQPGVEEFIKLRERAGWGFVTRDSARTSIDNALYSVCLRKNAELVGLGRVVGDGALYFYISDVLVSPDLHGGGHGTRIMGAIRNYIDSVASQESTVAIVSAPGKEGFYQRFGFTPCPNKIYGSGMVYLELIQ